MSFYLDKDFDKHEQDHLEIKKAIMNSLQVSATEGKIY